MKGAAKTVADYLAELPDVRRPAVAGVRDVILMNLPEGYAESMNWGMICYEVPLAIEPKTYNGQPLMYAALASQKNHLGLYLCSLACIPGAQARFAAAWKKTGKKLDMGKVCVRFRKLEDLDLKIVGDTIASIPMADFIKASHK